MNNALPRPVSATVVVRYSDGSDQTVNLYPGGKITCGTELVHEPEPPYISLARCPITRQTTRVTLRLTGEYQGGGAGPNGSYLTVEHRPPPRPPRRRFGWLRRTRQPSTNRHTP